MKKRVKRCLKPCPPGWHPRRLCILPKGHPIKFHAKKKTVVPDTNALREWARRIADFVADNDTSRRAIADAVVEGIKKGLEAAKDDSPLDENLCKGATHDDRWCGQCEAMQDGIDWLKGRIDALKKGLSK